MTPVPLFWLVAVVLVAAVLGALLWPLLRRRGDAAAAAPDETVAATSVYRDQRRQLDDDLAAGALTPEEHAAALDELASRLGNEIDARPDGRGEATASPASASSTRSPWIVALLLVAVVPIAAVVGYLVLGNPAAMSSDAATAMPGGVGEQQMRAMVDNLAQKMKANPGDANGWILLARSQAALGRFAESAEAYAQAAERLPPDAQLYADWADVAAMAQGRKLAGRPEALVARALATDPKNLKALALSATAKLERGDIAGSLAQWRALRALLPPGSDDAREIDTVIAQIEGPRQGSASAPPTAAATPSAAAPPAPTVAGAPKGTPAAVTGRVEVDPKVASRVAPDDTVFVLARAAEGPRMPLAVQRFRAAELPRAFRLDDSMAMAPGATLSSAARVVVEARVSKSGNAIAQSGDVRGTSAPIAPGATDLRIVIGDVVP